MRAQERFTFPGGGSAPASFTYSDRIDLLEKEKEELQERANEALRDLQVAQTEVRAKGRELDNIKVLVYQRV
jgi:hypothetical protein